jgi:GTP-binding protein Era
MQKSGYIAIIGKPNVGKSTLINSIIGEKVAITTHKPQTTRNRITGILTTKDSQLIFVDTPGIHDAKTVFNKNLVDASREALSNADVVLMIVDACENPNHDDLSILKSLQRIEKPVFLVINKIDLMHKEKLLPLIDDYQKRFRFREVIPLSALKNFNIDRLIELIRLTLPEGPKYYPDDFFTDQSERFLAAEIIREKVTLLTQAEVPYACAVIIDSFKEDKEKGVIVIQAVIYVEKNSQKGIMIGNRGAMLKEIGRLSRLDIEKIFNSKIYLELYVRTRKNWTRDMKMLREFGYTNEGNP